MKSLIRVSFTLFILTVGAWVHAVEWIHENPGAGDFPIVTSAGTVTTVAYSNDDSKIVAIAAADLASDIERVTGHKTKALAATDGLKGPLILAGTLGKNPLIDQLVANGKLTIADLRGQWESFLISTVVDPFPGVPQALVIVGSDRRGTAYGVYEISQAIGVSPWHWWADVTPRKKSALYVASGTHRFGPPSVKYRGIFINDEDWGLQPWAAQTFEPENKGIGPKTYQKVFELLLRLKANTLWPAMHKCTNPFNAFPESARLSDDYAIVMGSSHAEPMLRNNVGEWTAPPETYNYFTNREGVMNYWEERLTTNGRYENLYTLGMRGIHDSGIQGAKNNAERTLILEQIFNDQRYLLGKHVRPEVNQIPQIFCAYKEVLDLYRKGLNVPDDVTIVWPDDNFGYIRNFASLEERKRSGGFGVYYHISYLGKPLAYLWLCTTPPTLIWEEMSKAYDHGADRVWIVNVGDIKPAEICTEFFLQMAWDIKRWRRDNLSDYLTSWAAREFGEKHATNIGAIMEDYYQLNFARKPEHLQWWLPGQKPQHCPWTETEIEQRLARFGALESKVMKLAREIPAPQADAFNELVRYPVVGSAEANLRYFAGEKGDRLSAAGHDEFLNLSTNHFGEMLAGGKWAGFMRLEPADNDWRSMRIARWEMPTLPPQDAPTPAKTILTIEAERFSEKRPCANGAAWEVMPKLGPSGDSVAVFPTTTPRIALEKASEEAPRLDYPFELPSAGECTLNIHLLPTQAIAGSALRLAVAIDDNPAQLVELVVNDGGPEWAQGVLNATRIASCKLVMPASGRHTLHLYGLEAGVVVDKFSIEYP